MIRLPSPTRTLAALSRVREAHPYARSGRIARTTETESHSTQLWERLLGMTEQERRAAAAAFTPRDDRLLFLTALSRLAHFGSLRVLADVFYARTPYNGGRVAFYAYLSSDGAEVFRPHAQAFAAAHPLIPTWQTVTRAGEPLSTAAEAFLQQSSPFDEWVDEAGVRLGISDHVAKQIRFRLISPAFVPRVLARRGGASLVGWVNELLSSDEMSAWYADYLNLTDTSTASPDDAVLNEILRRYREPAQERPFWSRVAAGKADAFRAWLRYRELAELIGQGERLEFWRIFVPWIEKSFRSRQNDAVFIQGKHWFAVQYVAMGTATYLFEIEQLPSARRQDARAQLTGWVRSAPHLDRYTHQGYFWADRAEAIVRGVIRRRS